MREAECPSKENVGILLSYKLLYNKHASLDSFRVRLCHMFNIWKITSMLLSKRIIGKLADKMLTLLWVSPHVLFFKYIIKVP